MKKEKPSLEEYFELPNPGLWAYFKHVESGNTEDYRPPFWKDETREAVLERWQKILDSLDVAKRYPDLYKYEQDMKGKVGPMSIQLPLEQRLTSIEDYFTLIEQKSEPIDDRAIAATKSFFSRAGGIHIRSKAKTMLNMRLNTNSGCPYFTKRKRVAAKTSDYFISDRSSYGDEYIQMTHTPGDPHYKIAAVLGWRGQEGGISNDDVKQRVVWMMPFLLNIEELQFYQPAIEAVQKNGCIPAYISMDAVDREVTELFDTKGNNDAVICTDFTAFDQHFNKDMQRAAFEVEQSLLTQGWRGKIDRQQHEEMFPIKFNIPLICSENLMYVGAHGMGSGSGGTNFDECMAHKALQFEAAITANAELNPHSMAYGDDGILTYPGITVEHVIQTYKRHGQEMNASKQYVSTHDCVVLRRWHGTDYRVNGTMVGVYSTFRALGRLLAQERYYDPDKWSKELVTLRALSILENCKWSPYFHEFIDFVMTGDKYRLGLDLPGFFQNLEHRAKEATEEFTDFLGYTKTLQGENDPTRSVGINDWEVVKYIKSKM